MTVAKLAYASICDTMGDSLKKEMSTNITENIKLLARQNVPSVTQSTGNASIIEVIRTFTFIIYLYLCLYLCIYSLIFTMYIFFLKVQIPAFITRVKVIFILISSS